jgi:Pyruvate/2-oxoacid:ferredoxin oxidoreductase delta subunit
MMDGSQSISRRGLFGALVRPFSRHLTDKESEPTAPDGESSEPIPKTAIIQGRFCLAYQGGMCFTCSERCPEPGAITTKNGIPTVHADLCTGCGICHDLCPAPRNAILVVDKKT